MRVTYVATFGDCVVVTHSWSTGIIKAASLHVLAAVPRSTLFEYRVQQTAFNLALNKERFPLVSGCVHRSAGPGTDIVIDDEVVEKYRIHP